MGKGTFDSNWNNTRQQIQEFQQYNQRLVGRARAKGEFSGTSAHIQVNVTAKIKYIGTPNDATLYTNQLFTHAKIPKTLWFTPDWKGSNQFTVTPKFF